MVIDKIKWNPIIDPERLKDVSSVEMWQGKTVLVSDLFEEEISFEFIATIYAQMSSTPLTTFEVINKDKKRAIRFYNWIHNNIKKGLGKENLFNIIFPPLNVILIWTK